MKISVEYKKGDIAKKKDRYGQEWHTKKPADYGYILNTKAPDGDHLDVYLGKSHNPDKVFVVRQLTKDGKYDEDKVFMDFKDANHAKQTFMKLYRDRHDGRFGGIVELPMSKFKSQVAGLQKTARQLHAGGPGSGCNPDVAKPKCGRPAGAGSTGGGKTKWDGKTPTNKYFKIPGNGYEQTRVADVHEPILSKYENKPAQMNPVLHIIGGGTASGKSQFANMAASQLRQPAVVNTDLIRADLPEYQTGNPQVGGALHDEAGDVRDATLFSALSHKNDVALDAPGSEGLAKKLDALEQAGYKVAYTYVHRPVEESLMMAAHRAKTATNPADRRIVPEDVTRNSHQKARAAFQGLAKPGREVKIYDGSGAKVGGTYQLAYHRLADGTVKVYDAQRLERIMNGEEPKFRI